MILALCTSPTVTRLFHTLFVPSMNNHLVLSFMMRLAGNECTKFLAKKPTIDHHSIYFPEPGYIISFALIGITSYIPTLMLSSAKVKDLESDSISLLEITPQVNNWNSHSSVYQDQEDLMIDYKGKLKEPNQEKNHILSTNQQAVSEEHIHCVS